MPFQPRLRTRRGSVSGFTLPELMITVALAAILAAIALPSFHEFIIRMNVVEITNDLVGSLNTARTEAIKRGVSVAVVPAGGGWSAGWEVKADLDRDGTFETAVGTAHGPVPESYSVVGATWGAGGDNGWVAFSADGAMNPSTADYDLNVCRPSTSADASMSRLISIGSSGQISSRRDVSTDSHAGTCS